MIVSLAGTGVHLSDGATNILPVAPHRGDALTAGQISQNFTAVHSGCLLGYLDHLHSLKNGIYQGWNLHPAQLVTRYAALASLFGDVFDDAATGQGQLNFFLPCIACGAITEAEAFETGLTLEEIRSRSFYRILTERRRQAD